MHSDESLFEKDTRKIIKPYLHLKTSEFMKLMETALIDEFGQSDKARAIYSELDAINSRYGKESLKELMMQEVIKTLHYYSVGLPSPKSEFFKASFLNSKSIGEKKPLRAKSKKGNSQRYMLFTMIGLLILLFVHNVGNNNRLRFQPVPGAERTLGTRFRVGHATISLGDEVTMVRDAAWVDEFRTTSDVFWIEANVQIHSGTPRRIQVDKIGPTGAKRDLGSRAPGIDSALSQWDRDRNGRLFFLYEGRGEYRAIFTNPTFPHEQIVVAFEII